jgi:ribokinase
VAEADNTIVVIPGANALVGADDVRVVPLLAGDVAVSQFEIPLPTIAAFFQRAREAEALTLLNPAPAMKIPSELLALVDILVLNEIELGFLADADLADSDEAAKIIAVARSLQARQDQTICVTLGKRGVLALAGGEEIAVPGRAVTAIDTTGAGDCFVGALAAQLAGGEQLCAALAFANAAASISVQRMGAGPSMPTAKEVAAVL